MTGRYDGLLVVAFGGPEGPDDVLPFLRNTVRGRGVPESRLREVAEHYRLFQGRSPINEQSRALVASISRVLKDRGEALPVYLGNRNWHPFLADTLATMRAGGVRNALAFFTSPYSSYSSCRQYLEDVERARSEVGSGAPRFTRLRHYFNHPAFIEAVARGARPFWERLSEAARGRAAILFSAHSIPLAMAKACDYEVQLREASSLVAGALAPGHGWELVWQSRSGPPGVPWLDPQVTERLESLAAAGVEDVVLIPIGFISDHVEVLYDLDVEAAEAASKLGLNLHRCPTVGTDIGFVEMIAELVAEKTEGRPPRWVGSLGPRVSPCVEGCCPPSAGSPGALRPPD